MTIGGKNALVTGAGKRGGRAIALELARSGVHIAVHYHTSRTAALNLVRRIKELGVRARAFQADLSRLSRVDRLVSQVRAVFGPIDLLVNNAADFYRTPLGKITESDWDHFLDTNLKGPFFLSQRIGLAMKRRKRGVIVSIADWAGIHPYRNHLPYSISKSGLIVMTKGLARALGSKVRVYALAPQRLKRFSELAAVVMKLVEGKRFKSGATYSIDGRPLTR